MAAPGGSDASLADSVFFCGQIGSSELEVCYQRLPFPVRGSFSFFFFLVYTNEGGHDGGEGQTLDFSAVGRTVGFFYEEEID